LAEIAAPSVAGGRSLVHRRWLILGLIIAAGILNYVDRQIIAVLKPVIESDLHWTDRDYSRLTLAFQTSAAFAFVFTGWIIDRLGVKWANPLGVATWSLAAMAHGWATTFPQFAVARVALGASESMGTPSGMRTLASLFTARQRSWAIGVLNASGNFGAIFTPLIVPFVAAAYGWRSTFVIVGALGFGWVILWLAATAGLRNDPAPPATLADGPKASILVDRRTWAIAGAKTLSDQGWWLLLFWAPDFFHRVFGMGLTKFGAPLATIYGCAAAGSLAAGFAASRLLSRGLSVNTVRKGMLLLAAILVLPLPLALHVHDAWLAVGLIGLMLAAHQAFSVNLFGVITDIIPADRVGRVTSFGALCGNLGGMAILFVAGEVLSRGFGYGPLFAWLACAYLLAIGWLQLLLPRLRPAEPSEDLKDA
jgi:ACS family hexuronate transporter-like MFS transporter